MCTLAVAFQTDRLWPLVAAANRDERIDRPAEGWGLRTLLGGRQLAAPLDLLAGGTWIGVSENGLFAAVTNFHSGEPPDPARRSRGELVGLASAAPSAAEAREALGKLEAAAYNPFHLLVADGEGGFLWWYDGSAAGFERLRPGLHVVTERARDGTCPRGELVRARWPVDPTPARLRDILTVHAEDLQAATCIHLDPAYGTRSSAILRLARSLEHSELYAADGRPCTSPLEDRSELLVALARGRAGSA